MYVNFEITVHEKEVQSSGKLIKHFDYKRMIFTRFQQITQQK